jgi:very-short-patch-repair endonuclease
MPKNMLVAVIVLGFIWLIVYQSGIGEEEKAEKNQTLSKFQGGQRYPLVYMDEWENPQKPIKSYNENKGKSEAYFLKYLQKYFSGQIQIDLALQINQAYYYPDFTFFSKKHQLYIDIEIDEPYNFKGKPTHCIGFDDTRNLFFMEAGWIVVRFTEEQVVRQPVQCCKFIADIIARITKDSSYTHIFKHIPTLTILPSPWSSQKATQMFHSKFRDSYLHILK